MPTAQPTQQTQSTRRPAHRFPDPLYPIPKHYKVIDESCPKQRELPPDYKPDHTAIARKSETYRAPGKLFYGFGLKFQDLTDYADAHSLFDWPVDLENAVDRYIYASVIGMEHLRSHCGFQGLEIATPISPEYHIGIMLYDNYTIDESKLEREQEENVVRILKEAMPVFKTQNPRWFFDRYDDKNGAWVD